MQLHRVVSCIPLCVVLSFLAFSLWSERGILHAEGSPSAPDQSSFRAGITTSSLRNRTLRTTRPVQRVTTRALTLARRPLTSAPAERVRQEQLQREPALKRSSPQMTTEVLRKFVTPTSAPISYDRGFSLILSSNRRSTVETCRCPAHPLGSIDREARAVSAIAETSQPCIIVDAGGYLRVPANARNKMGAAIALEALAQMGVHAVNVGTTDLAAGLEFFQDLQTSYSVPFISANIFNSQGKLIFAAHKVLPLRLLDGTAVKVAVVGVARPAASSDVGLAQVLQSLRIEDPKPILDKLIPNLRQEVDLVVLLTFSTREEAPAFVQSLASEAKPDVVVCGEFTVGKQREYYLANATEQGGVWYLTGGFEGRQIGHAMIEVDEKRRIRSLASKLIEIEQTIPADPAFTAFIEKYQKGQTELFLRGQ